MNETTPVSFAERDREKILQLMRKLSDIRFDILMAGIEMSDESLQLLSEDVTLLIKAVGNKL